MLQQRHRHNNTFKYNLRRMGISVDEPIFQLIKAYATAHKVSMSKAIIDNLKLKKMKRAITEHQE